MGNRKTAIYIRLSDEDNNVDGIVKPESNSVAAQRILIRVDFPAPFRPMKP